MLFHSLIFVIFVLLLRLFSVIDEQLHLFVGSSIAMQSNILTAKVLQHSAMLICCKSICNFEKQCLNLDLMNLDSGPVFLLEKYLRYFSLRFF